MILPFPEAFDGPQVGGVLVEREMCTRLMVVGKVAGQDAMEVSLAENENAIQALAPDRADEPLRERVLPRAVRRREHLLDPHALHAAPKWLTVDLVPITHEIGGRGLVRESVHDLLGGPDGGGMLGNVEVDDPPAMVGKHNEDEKDAQAHGGPGEEIEGDQVPDMVGKERPPGLRRLGPPFRQQAGHGALGHIDTELEEPAMDARAPQSGFAEAMCVINALVSGLMGGRPPVGRPGSLVQ